MKAVPTGPPPPPPVSKLWTVRVCDHLFEVRWERVSGATGYDLEMRGKSWKRLLTNQNYHGFQFTQWTKNGTFRFRVRSVNAHEASAWRQVKSVAPPCAVDGLQAGYAANGDVHASWNPAKRADSYNVRFSSDNGNSWQQVVSGLAATSYSFNKDPNALPYGPGFLVGVQSRKGGLGSEWRNVAIAQIQLTASNVGATGATLNLAGHDGQWWYDADTGPHTACQGPVAAGTSTADLSGLTQSQQYTYQAYDASGCNDADLLAAITFTPTAAELAAQNVAATSATLELSNRTGDWWFKRTAPDAGTCTAGESDFTNDLTGLIPGTNYTYKSYDVDGCGDTHESASVDFTTVGVSVSNLGTQNDAGCPLGVSGSEKCATGFTTGNSANGYTLHSITAQFIGISGSPSNFAVTLRRQSNNKPANSDISDATFSGDTPSIAGNYTYTCSGAGCQLSANTTYYFVLSASGSGGNYYGWQYTNSDSESTTPSGNGWEIADERYTGSNLQNHSSNQVGKFKVSATVNASLTATVSDGKVTLTLANGPSNWWFKIGGTGTCTAASGSTVSNIGGYTGTQSVKAYSDNLCANELAATTFTVVVPPSLTASGISGTGATLTVGGHSGDWYYKGISGTEASTDCVTVSGSTTATLSGLTADKLYGYTAYSGASCTGTEIGADYFSTNDFDVGNLAETAASNKTCSLGVVGTVTNQCAVAFTTGSRSGGYTLKSVTGRFAAKSGSPGNIIVKVHAADSGNSANPATTAKVTLTGGNPDTAGLHTFTCSGSDCSLSASTKYFVVMSTADTSGSRVYRLARTASDAEAVHPSGNGWSIADVGRGKLSTGDWVDLGDSHTGLVHIAADNAGAGGGSLGADTMGPVLAWSNGQANTLRVPGWTIERDATGVLRASAKPTPAPAASRASAVPTPGSRDAGNDVTALAAAGNTSPDGLWSDGATLWVVDTDDRMLYAYDLASKARDSGNDVILSRNTRPLGLASDGLTLWVSDDQAGTVYAYPVPGASSAPGPDVPLHPANASPSALWTDGATLWVAEDTDGRLYAYDLSDGLRAPGKDLTLHADNASSGGLWSDGVTMWVSDPEDGRVYAYRLSDGLRDASLDYTVSGGSARVYGLWSDGWTLWVVDDGADRVVGYRAH